MSASERAFIQAYSDESGQAPESAQLRASPTSMAPKAARQAPESNGGSAAQTAPPRRSARRAIRSAAAAALASAPEPSHPSAAETNPVIPANPSPAASKP